MKDKHNKINKDQINEDQINEDQINEDQINEDQINEDQINKDMSTLEDLVGSIRERAKNCDPNIIYPLGQYQTVVDRLLTKYEEIREDPKYKNRFNILVKDFETYRGEYTYECECQKKR